jgi:hypothetical protein
LIIDPRREQGTPNLKPQEQNLFLLAEPWKHTAGKKFLEKEHGLPIVTALSATRNLPRIAIIIFAIFRKFPVGTET